MQNFLCSYLAQYYFRYRFDYKIDLYFQLLFPFSGNGRKFVWLFACRTRCLEQFLFKTSATVQVSVFDYSKCCGSNLSCFCHIILEKKQWVITILKIWLFRYFYLIQTFIRWWELLQLVRWLRTANHLISDHLWRTFLSLLRALNSRILLPTIQQRRQKSQQNKVKIYSI